MLTGQARIRQTFAHHWEQCSQAENTAWLIKGDFDHFKLTNDLYGALITDYLLDWTLEVIEAELKAHQARWGCGEILCSVTGDDLTIYIPPGPLGADAITQMLWKTRAAVEASFSGRYMVGALPLPWDFFEGVAPAFLESMRNDLEAVNVVLDFARRESGYLLLIPVGADGRYDAMLRRVIHTIESRTGKPIPPIAIRFNWLYNPQDQTRSTFNQGFIDPPTVSFAACSVKLAAGEVGRRNGTMVYEGVSSACEAVLKTCKQQRKGVLFQNIDSLSDLSDHPAALSTISASSNLHWYSERCLREKLFFKPLDRPVLFQFNPVYRLRDKMPPDFNLNEKYRGNQYGIGLKGINEILGRHTADRVIVQLISIVSKVTVGALISKGFRPESVSIAQFVDRFTVFCEQRIFDLTEIVDLVRCLVALFNAVSEEIKISHLRASVVFVEMPVPGYRLFNDLALTSLSSSSIVIAGDPPVEVRRNSCSALTEGRIVLEYNAHSSALLLSRFAVNSKILGASSDTFTRVSTSISSPAK